MGVVGGGKEEEGDGGGDGGLGEVEGKIVVGYGRVG